MNNTMHKFPTTAFSFAVLESKELPVSFKEKIAKLKKTEKKTTVTNRADKSAMYLSKEEFSFEDMI